MRTWLGVQLQGIESVCRMGLHPPFTDFHAEVFRISLNRLDPAVKKEAQIQSVNRLNFTLKENIPITIFFSRVPNTWFYCIFVYFLILQTILVSVKITSFDSSKISIFCPVQLSKYLWAFLLFTLVAELNKGIYKRPGTLNYLPQSSVMGNNQMDHGYPFFFKQTLLLFF